MIMQCSIPIRIRYVECDSMGFLHHSNYLPFFEMGRTELLRLCGMSYRDLEERGIFFVVARIGVTYKKPARYDDELELVTRIVRQTQVRIDHTYELYNARTHLLLCTAESTIACVNREGQISPIPEILAAAHLALKQTHSNSPDGT
jgi:acyl-CoA thioester hydrolase